MGAVGGQLLSALGGQDPSAGGMPMGVPIPPMAGDPAPVNNVPALAEEEVLAVQGFKPTHRNIFGRLADMWLQAQGQKPIYEGRMQERDMKRAFEGFSSDPKAVASRLAQMGRPDLAVSIWDKAEDNERGNEAQDRLIRNADMKHSADVHTMIANTLGAANEKNWPLMRQRLMNYAQRSGVELMYDLPETWDEGHIDSIRYGKVPVAKQMTLEDNRTYRDQRLAQQDRGLDIRENRAGSQNRVDDARIENMEGRLEQTTRANDIRERGQAGAGGPQGVSPGGNPNIKYHPDGNQAMVRIKGVWHRYKKVGDDRWELVP
jgi:hypothetical protein